MVVTADASSTAQRAQTSVAFCSPFELDSQGVVTSGSSVDALPLGAVPASDSLADVWTCQGLDEADAPKSQDVQDINMPCGWDCASANYKELKAIVLRQIQHGRNTTK